MKKVLFISNYKENTGYGIASRHYLEALKTIDSIDLVCRHVGFGKERLENDLYIYEEDKFVDNIDLTIINTLPEYCDIKPNSKTVGLFYWEANPLPDKWRQNISSNFDAAICANIEEATMVKAQTNIESYMVGIPFCGFKSEIEERVHLMNNSQFVNDKTYVFGSISSLNGRKNVYGLITSYFLAFQNFENVVLILHFNEKNAKAGEFSGMVEELKSRLKLENYPKILYSFGEIKQEQLEKLQSSFDTYVSMSHGESWNLPMFDSAAMGKRIITSKCNGNDYLENIIKNDSDNYKEIESRVVPCMQEGNYMKHLYNGNQLWRTPDVLEAAFYMKNHYDLGKIQVKFNTKLIEDYSPENIGKELEKVINEVLS